jgi:hypothetical protein
MKTSVDLPAQGVQVEEYTRRLAAYMGVPDFVYRSERVRKGDASRELSDGLLIAGDRACILQVKSRSRAEGLADDESRAERWVRKHSEEGRRQGLGTRRQLVSSSVEFSSLRGYQRRVKLEPETPIVVIIDHPLDPEIEPKAHDDTVFISLSDWLGLHFMIRSTAGIIDYVERVLNHDVYVPLGSESQRYSIFASADQGWARASNSAMSVPQLPSTVLSDEEAFCAAFYDELIDRVADSNSLGWDAEQYLHIVEHLDVVPTLARVNIGRKMVSTFQAMVNAKARRSFLVSDADKNSRIAVLYDYTEENVDDAMVKLFMARIGSFGVLRHHQAIEAGASPGGSTLAVGILHHPLYGRAAAFGFIKGKVPSLPAQLRGDLESEFGVWTGKEMHEASRHRSIRDRA